MAYMANFSDKVVVILIPLAPLAPLYPGDSGASGAKRIDVLVTMEIF